MFKRSMAPLVLACWLAFSASAQAQLPDAVKAQLAAANIPDTAVGALVLRGNDTLVSHLADRPMQPASTMKILTTLAGLEQLTPIFRGRTELRTAAPLTGDVLKGDLILRGGADMDLSGEVLTRMLQALRNQGIRQIDGRLVLDRELFSPARLDVGVPPFDESPEAYYNVIPDALLINKNMLLLDMRSDGQKVRLAMEPALENVTIDSDFTLINGDCAKWEAGWKLPEVRRSGERLTVLLHGTFPRNCVAANSINVLDRHDYLDRLFRLTWKQLGGSIGPETVEGAGPADTRLLTDHVARALPELLRDINKPSDNTLARTLFLSLGSLQVDNYYGSKPLPGTGPTAQRADVTIRAWLRAKGIDDAGLVLDNGAGLSRGERITALQLGRVLQAGMDSRWAPEYISSLPIAGMDGTMRRRLLDSPAAGRARIKTGALKDAVAIAGYVPDANGKLCVVVAMINSDLVGAGRGRAVLDALINWVARTQ